MVLLFGQGRRPGGGGEWPPRPISASTANSIQGAPHQLPASTQSGWPRAVLIHAASSTPVSRAVALAAAEPRTTGGCRGARGTVGLGAHRCPPASPGGGVATRDLAAGCARCAALLQLPRRLAQRAEGAGRGAGGPRVGEWAATRRDTRREG